MPDDRPTTGNAMKGGWDAIARRSEVSQLINSASAWIRDALNAWSEDDYRRVAVLAPLAVEHLGKAVLWSENPVLVVPLTADSENTLFGLATKPNLADPKLRTVGLSLLLKRLEALLGGLPIDKGQRVRMVETRNGAMHVGTPAQSRHVLIDSLILCDLMLERLDRDPEVFYRGHRANVQTLMDEKRTEVGHRVAAKRARARRHLTELEDKLGSDVFREACDRLEDEATETITGTSLESSWCAVGKTCPECGSQGCLLGPVELDPVIHYDREPSGDGTYDSTPYQSGWDVTLTPTSFACNVCRLELAGAAELAECSLPDTRVAVDPYDLGRDFDPDAVAEQLYGIGD
jgi:hypothetical protein